MSGPFEIVKSDLGAGISDLSTQLGELRRHFKDGRKRWIVFTGAGVSTASGIPDFRSPEGLFSRKYPCDDGHNLSTKDLLDGKIVWKQRRARRPHMAFMRDLSHEVGKAKPNLFHYWLARYMTRVKRLYTMNVDSFHTEALQDAELTKNQIIHLHGILKKLRCTRCCYTTTPREVGSALFAECPKCVERNRARLLKGGRPTAIGQLRTDVLLYDDKHREAEHQLIRKLMKHDLDHPVKIFLVAGTRLALEESKKDVLKLGLATRRNGGITVWLSKEEPPTIPGWPGWDYMVIGDCLTFAEHMG